MGLTLEIRNVDKVVGMFLRFPDEVARFVRPAMGEAMANVATRAALTHRYITRSGMLDRSIQSEVDATGFVGRVYLEPGIAAYGQYIHEGFKSWAPDRFLNESLQANTDDIVEKIQDAVNAAVAALRP